jgi:hypothetical protein
MFVGRQFQTEREYRNALARAKGYPSWAVQQQAPGREVRGRRDLRRLRPSEQAAHERAGSVLTLMRRDGLSLEQASGEVHTTPAAVKRHAGDALFRTKAGRYVVAASDTHYRRLILVTADGLTVVETRDSRQASEIAAYDSAIRYFLATGDTTRLRPFEGRTLRVGGKRYRIVTDPDSLEELGRRGEVSFESIYARTT